MWSKRNVLIIIIVALVLVAFGVWSFLCNATEKYQNVLLGFSAFLTPLLAFLGFDSWKSEMHYRKLSDVSYRAISRIRELRESVQVARSNYITGPDWEKWRGTADAPLPRMSDGFDVKYESSVKMVLDRLWSLIDMRHELSIFWKGVLDKPLAELRDHILLLDRTTSLYFGLAQLVFASKSVDKTLRDQFVEDERILFLSKENDNYDSRVDALISDIEKHLRKYI